MNASEYSHQGLSHEQVFEWLQKQKDGRLKQAERQRLSQHLSTCPQCRAEAVFEQKLPALLSGMPTKEAFNRDNHRLGERQIIHAAQLALRRRRLWTGMVQTAAWAAAALLLVLYIGWAVESAQPGSGKPDSISETFSSLLTGLSRIAERGADTLPDLPGQPEQDQATVDWTQPGLVVGLLAPALLLWLAGLAYSLRRNALAWLYTLSFMLSLALILIARTLNNLNQENALPILIAASVLVVLFVALLAALLWFNRAHWSPQIYLLPPVLMVALAVIYGIMLLPPQDRPLLLILFGLGFVPVILWQVLGFRGPWRWLAALFSILLVLGSLAAVLSFYAVDFLPQGWPIGLDVIINILMVYLFFAGVAAGRLVQDWLAGMNQPAGGIWLRLVTALLLFADSFVVLRAAAVDNSTSEAPLVASALWFFSLTGAMVAGAALALKLPDRRLWIGLALLLAFELALFPAVLFSPAQAWIVTEQRADTLVRGIERFHAENGVYPASLEELTPDYVRWIPRPVTFLDRRWCYDSGTDYYSLSYYYAERFSHPSDVVLRQFAASGSPPPGPPACEEALIATRPR